MPAPNPNLVSAAQRCLNIDGIKMELTPKVVFMLNRLETLLINGTSQQEITYPTMASILAGMGNLDSLTRPVKVEEEVTLEESKKAAD